MVKPASLPRYCGSLACLGLLLSSAPAVAQQAKPVDNSKIQSEEAVFIPIEYRPPPYQISIGVRISGKAKVKFNGLGAIPGDVSPGTTTDAVQNRTYNDGAIGLDSTYDINGKKVDPTDGKTNYWSFSTAEQLVTHPTLGRSIAYHAYAVESRGATAEAENGASNGWDIEISRELGGNRRISWGVNFGANLNRINCKTSGTIQANLRTMTDYYPIGDLVLPVVTRVTGVHEQYVTDSQGNYVLVDGVKTTFWPNVARLPDHPAPDRTETVDTANPVDVVGYWQVKGAYMTARLGPYVAVQLGRHFAVRASAGVTFTVLGANLVLHEKYMIPVLSTYLEIDNQKRTGDATVSGTLGYYVEGELDAFITNRTGFFIGASHEDYTRDIRISGPYSQTADLSVSSGTAIRTGITTRF